MRFSYVLVVIAVALLVSTEALSMIKDSKQAEVSSPDPVQSTDVVHVAKRFLRSDDDDDDDGNEDLEEEERGVNMKPLTEAKMWTMKRNNMSAKAYAKKMGIYDTMKEIQKTGRGWSAFQRTHRFQKYMKYFNFLKENS